MTPLPSPCTIINVMSPEGATQLQGFSLPRRTNEKALLSKGCAG